jgi:hypothetical protein
VSPALVELIKKIDQATARNTKVKMGSFVVFCSDEEKLEATLKELARKEKIDHCVLSIVNRKAGPTGYDLHPAADVTVVLYVNRTVKANFAFKKGELKDPQITSILADLPKILPEK